MPIDPYAALNAMLRAEVARFSPPVRKDGQDRRTAARPTTGGPTADGRPGADRTVPQPAAAADAEPVSGTARQDPAGSAA
ncbi:hypothetical protein AB0D45_05975 [Streptomyces sp. NPDC048352]|uniref:hypothetical protein n=1 Tax=Streptomyces sp. NPDC048352 TaxID=3154718 RepID=UPI00343BCA86